MSEKRLWVWLAWCSAWASGSPEYLDFLNLRGCLPHHCDCRTCAPQYWHESVEQPDWNPDKETPVWWEKVPSGRWLPYDNVDPVVLELARQRPADWHFGARPPGGVVAITNKHIACQHSMLIRNQRSDTCVNCGENFSHIAVDESPLVEAAFAVTKQTSGSVIGSTPVEAVVPAAPKRNGERHPVRTSIHRDPQEFRGHLTKCPQWLRLDYQWCGCGSFDRERNEDIHETNLFENFTMPWIEQPDYSQWYSTDWD